MMGSSSSKVAPIQEKNDNARPGSFQRVFSERFLVVERFIGRHFEEGYISDSIRNLCMKSPQAFKEFLTADSPGQTLGLLVDFIKDFEVTKGLKGKDLGRLVNIIDVYIAPGSSLELLMISPTVRAKTMSVSEHELTLVGQSSRGSKLSASIATVEKEAIDILSIGPYPRFLESQHYLEWKREEVDKLSFRSKNAIHRTEIPKLNQKGIACAVVA